MMYLINYIHQNLLNTSLKINPDLIISLFHSAAACVYNFKVKYPNIKIPSTNSYY